MQDFQPALALLLQLSYIPTQVGQLQGGRRPLLHSEGTQSFKNEGLALLQGEVILCLYKDGVAGEGRNQFRISYCGLDRVQHCHCLGSLQQQHLLHLLLQQRPLDIVLVACPGGVDLVDKGNQHGGGIASVDESADGQQSSIIPPLHQARIYHGLDLPLRQHVPLDVQARVLPHHWLPHLQEVQEGVVEFPPDLELQRAERVVDVFKAVAGAVREVVGGVDFELGACAGVRVALLAVDHWVPEGRVDCGGLCFEAEGLGAGEVREYFEVFLDGPFSEGVGQFVFPLVFDFFLGALADVGVAVFDELVGQSFQLFEVVAGEGDLVGSVAQPLDVLLDFLDELVGLLVGVGVVVAQVAGAAGAEGRLEVDAHGFEVADVEVAVGFGGEAEPQPALGDLLVGCRLFFGVALDFELSGLDVCDFVPELVVFFLVGGYEPPLLGNSAHLLVDQLAVDGSILLPQGFADRVDLQLLPLRPQSSQGLLEGSQLLLVVAHFD